MCLDSSQTTSCCWEEKLAGGEPADGNHETTGADDSVGTKLLKDYLQDNRPRKASAQRMIQAFRKRRVRIREVGR